jgi:hypothetical protein
VVQGIHVVFESYASSCKCIRSIHAEKEDAGKIPRPEYPGQIIAKY